MFESSKFDKSGLKSGSHIRLGPNLKKRPDSGQGQGRIWYPVQPWYCSDLPYSGFFVSREDLDRSWPLSWSRSWRFEYWSWSVMYNVDYDNITATEQWTCCECMQMYAWCLCFAGASTLPMPTFSWTDSTEIWEIPQHGSCVDIRWTLHFFIKG